MKRIEVVYVSGPYTAGNVDANLRAAIDAAERLHQAGFVPLVPHLNHLWDIRYGHSWAVWLKMDLALVARCDAVVRLAGESPGADREVAEAERLGIPVFQGVQALLFAKAEEDVA